jgi:hypothetical protein
MSAIYSLVNYRYVTDGASHDFGGALYLSVG